MKLTQSLLFFILTASSSYALEMTIGGKKYSCDPIDQPKESWFCSIDLSYHGGGVHTGSGQTRFEAASEAKSDCSNYEASTLKNLCGLPPTCESGN